VAENQPTKNRVTSSFCQFKDRLVTFMHQAVTHAPAETGVAGSQSRDLIREKFNGLALELFALQYDLNSPFRRICDSRGVTPRNTSEWNQIPALTTAAFKELDISCLPPQDRTSVFFSSGTTDHRPSRHFHSDYSLAIYKDSLSLWFESRVLSNRTPFFVCLSPPAGKAPNSSLVHMFDVLLRTFGSELSCFVGDTDESGRWIIDAKIALKALAAGGSSGRPVFVLGTAFSFVHFLDQMNASNACLELPPGSIALETGGYKGRSRSLPQDELHSLIAAGFGLPRDSILREYGMCELSAQAYATAEPRRGRMASMPLAGCTHNFSFPPWARVQIISPENGQEVAEGETGLLKVFDLSNVYSVLAIQTEDLATSRGEAFELIGRAAMSESRGCSLLAAG
jgi:hypothetical protein